MSNKTKYWCKECNAEFFITIKPSHCPICGGDELNIGTRKSFNTAQKYIAECNELIPLMSKKYEEISKLYSRYMTIHETLRTYANRGIIDKQGVPEFHPFNLTEKFYASRKKENKYE